MAFTVQLYNNTSEPERIGKALSPTVSFTGSLKEQTSIINPTIIVNSPSVPSGNYARIDAFGRYYFITDISSVRNNIWEIKMHVDVMQTYADQIKNTTQMIERQEFNYNNYIQDNLVPLTSGIKQDVITFSSGGSFQTDNYILTMNTAAID